ncbi:MAG: endopeptidase La, partial [Nitrospinae bacterium CG11_big_fil_rev_8_21_14_0_20_56_8]
AGITMAVAMVSALTGVPVRNSLAMTGELTLSGKVLAIGGLKEKSLAAHRGDIFQVIIPKDNEKDLPDIPATIRKEMEFIPVKNMDEVIDLAFDGKFRLGKKKSGSKKKKASRPSRSSTSRPTVTTLN